MRIFKAAKLNKNLWQIILWQKKSDKKKWPQKLKDTDYFFLKFQPGFGLGLFGSWSGKGVLGWHSIEQD